MKRLKMLAPAAGLLVAGCLASKTDILLLQSQLGSMQRSAATWFRSAAYVSAM